MESKFSQQIGACEDNFKSFYFEMDSKLEEMDTKLSVFLNQVQAFSLSITFSTLITRRGKKGYVVKCIEREILFFLSRVV